MVNEKRRFWKLLLFTLPTLGIYNIVFWYRFTKDLNEMNREEKKIKNYILVCILSILTLGIYRMVWVYYLADRIKVTGEQYDRKIHPGAGVTLFFWTFGRFVLFGPLLADFFLIRNMNRVAKEYNAFISKNSKVITPDIEFPDLPAIANKPATSGNSQPNNKPATPGNGQPNKQTITK